jgi:hypothetical protein
MAFNPVRQDDLRANTTGSLTARLRDPRSKACLRRVVKGSEAQVHHEVIRLSAKKLIALDFT